MSVFRFFILGRMLEIVHELEEIVAGGLQAHPGLIGQAKQNELAVLYLAFYIFIMYAVDLYFTVYAFKSCPVGLVGKGEGYAHFYELGIVVIVLIEACFEASVCLVL